MSDVRLTATNPEDSSVVPVACNSKGELLLEEIPDQSFDGDLDGNLNVTGSADFAGRVKATYFNSRQDSGFSSSFTSYIATDINGDVNATIYASGAAEFAGEVVAGSPEVGDGSNVLGAVLSPFGLIKAQRPGSNEVIQVFQQGSATPKASISADGSAEFAGGLNANSVSARIVEADTPNKDDSKTFRCKNTGGTETFTVFAKGSAKFAGDVIVGSRNKQWMLVEQGGLCHMIEETRRSPVATADLVEPDEPKYPKLRDVFHELDLIEQALEVVMTKLRLDPPAGWPVWDGSDNHSETD